MFAHTAKEVSVQLIAAVCMFLMANVSSALSFEEICVGATAIDSNGSAWSAGYDEVQVFNADIASPGILVVNVETSVPAEDSPRLVFLGRGCVESGTAEDFVIVEQGATYQLIAIRAPGTYSLRLASAGIGRSLGEYELRLSFTPTEVIEEEVVLELGQGRRMTARQAHFFVDQSVFKSDEEVVDPYPDGLLMNRLGLKSDEEIVDPYPDGFVVDCSRLKSDEETVDPYPDGLLSNLGLRPVLSLVALYITPQNGSKEGVADPNSESMTFPSDVVVAASLVLFPSRPSVNPGELCGGTNEPDVSRGVVLEWLVEILQDGLR